MISVVMITMNEERSVGIVIDGIRQAVSDAEILIVDSSHDRFCSTCSRSTSAIPPSGTP